MFWLATVAVGCSLFSPLGDLSRCDGDALSENCPDVPGRIPASGGSSGAAGSGAGGSSAGTSGFSASGASGAGGVPSAAGQGGSQSCASDEQCGEYSACQQGNCTPALRVLYADNRDLETQPTNSRSIRPYLRLINYGSQTFPLSELSLRYYYTIELSGAEDAACMYSRGDNPSCSEIEVAFGEMSQATSTANRYFEVSFSETAGTLGAHGNQSDDFKLRIFKVDGTEYDETNDFSYDPTKTALTEWAKVTLYHNGQLVWGTPP